ncbi:REP-associated tyrosine transposase [Cardiobacterium hominis]|uniref:REP-associated tyrosine transposase n=1 Tax=Cardiobacterium hominis TaxID=2718 RepID=UPI0028D10B52|nr:transposase [Cardiobacterium hominis]
MRYRRSQIQGGSYFFTINLQDRSQDLLVRHIEALRHAFRETQKATPFTLDAICILPEHLHLLMTLPQDDKDYPLRIRMIKTRFSKSIPQNEDISDSRIKKGERGIWQRRYWEHQIRDEKDFAHHVNYIHYNPVKHKYVSRVMDWPYSSFHRYVAAGILPANWAGDAAEFAEHHFGE